MGSADAPSRDELTVLVTGFGPFKEDFPVNPAWEIARLLPAYLPPAPAKSVMQTRRADAPVLPAVRIQRYPEPVRVSYQAVRSLVPTLWGDAAADAPTAGAEAEAVSEATPPPPPTSSSQGETGAAPGGDDKIDLMLHIGMAGPRPYYSIERRGHRDGYRMRDVDGELLGDEERHERQGKRWVWHGLPHQIETDLALEDVLDRWRGYTPWDSDLRISEDAGSYLCDFIYYSSLAHLHQHGERRRVLFLHVPADCSDEAVKRGVNLAVQLIRSICESERSGRQYPWDSST